MAAQVATDARLSLYRALVRPVLFRAGEPGLERDVFGLRFPTPIGLAAGFDKNAVAIPALAALGFGFVEVGTITRHAQPGNPRPRLFRLPAEEALINRMGFNNEGAEAVAARLARLPQAPIPIPIPIGISIGKSKVAPLEEAAADYLAALDQLYPYGDYFAVNVSSPNTPELRALQERDRLDTLLAALTARLSERAHAEGHASAKPLLVKISPDLDEAALEAVVEVCLARGAAGLIAINTTIARAPLGTDIAPALREEPGGLSGRPSMRGRCSRATWHAALAPPQQKQQQIHHYRQHHAEHETHHDRKEERRVAALDADVARQPPEKGDTPDEQQHQAQQHDRAACDEQQPPQITEVCHVLLALLSASGVRTQLSGAKSPLA